MVDTLDDSASGAVLHGAETAAHDAGLEVVVCAARTRTGSERPGRAWLERLVLRGSAGVLFHLAEPSPAQCVRLEQHRVPFALIDPACEPPSGAVSVGGANWQGGVTATEHLLALGHERVAVLAGPPDARCPAAHASPVTARRSPPPGCVTAPSTCATRTGRTTPRRAASCVSCSACRNRRRRSSSAPTGWRPACTGRWPSAACGCRRT